MRTDRELDALLAEIGADHRAMKAPERLEAVLCAAGARSQQSGGTKKLRAAWVWGLAVIVLAAIVFGALWQRQRIRGVAEQQVRTSPAPNPQRQAAAVTRQSEVQGNTVTMGGPSRGAASARLRGTPPKRSATKSPASDSLEEFIELPGSEGLPQAAELSVVRVRLLGSDLQQYGLEAPPDAAARTMLAEFVVGEDGLPRAIRIVQ